MWRHREVDKRWAEAAMPRVQQVLFSVSLDEVVARDHPIRQLDALLLELDWEAWEKEYNGHRGQPAIHPRLLAGAILYGLMRRIRSSRDLEDATANRLDFRWFLEGRTIDHSTFAGFRTAHGEKLQGLFEQIARRICAQNEQALLTLVIDGTRIRANSDRHGARTGKWLRHRIELCEEELHRRLAQMAKADEGFELEGEITRLQAEVAKYKRALEQAQKRDAVKQAKRGKNKALEVCVPVTDPDSMIVPNKEGGFAPNYTPTVAMDAATGAVILAAVPEGADEAGAVLPAVEQAKQLKNVTPQRVLADTSFASGKNLKELEAEGIEAYMPTDTDFTPENPANREDPTQPVPEDQRGKLPKRKGKFTRSAFIYDEHADAYHCPMGKTMNLQDTSAKDKCTYQCPGAANCPLAKDCVKTRVPARIITRDQYQHYRETVGRRMATPEGNDEYKKRAPAVEGTFAGIKHIMNFRTFHLRGLQKVRIEWLWVCISYNLKLVLKKQSEKQLKATEKDAILGQKTQLRPQIAFSMFRRFFTRTVKAAINSLANIKSHMSITTLCRN